jgi:hypothetical protein
MAPRPFPWLENDSTTTGTADTGAFRGKALDMYRAEVRTRAELLRHLGYSAKETTARCKANLIWDFEPGGHCPIEDEVPKIVQAVFRREKKD